ncbi:MAG: hypothetical protein JXA15_03045 [Spirochaetales bacterium]|nr:hypothetical protein [Spirochaetales bacterium]
MKFTTIFVLFNAVFAFSFLFIFLMPFVVLGAGSSAGFWSANWPMALFFVVALAALNGFFLANRRVFTLVEKEDWAALSSLLSERMYGKGAFRGQYVRLMVNASLLRADLSGVERLESELRSRKPAMLRRNAVIFAVPRLLRNDPSSVLSFCEEFLPFRDVDNRAWLGFFHAFALVLLKRGAEAAPELVKTVDTKDPTLGLLSAYLLANLAAPALGDPVESRNLVEKAYAKRSALRARWRKSEAWAREAERARTEVHVVILSKILDDAGRWLFEERADPPA